MNKKFKKFINNIKKLTKRKCYQFEVDSNNPNFQDNKFGGIAYLPEGEEYPKTKDGQMMSLLLQINFDGIKLKNFPTKGIL